MDISTINAFDDAQRRAIALLSRLIQRLEPGVTEHEVAEMTQDLLGEFGFTGWFHPPEVQFGPRTAAAPIWRVPSRRVRLARGAMVMVCLGPADRHAFGDVATTLAFQAPEPEILEVARACTRATCGYASRHKCVGELFVFARSWAVNHRYALANTRSIGHAILPPEQVPGLHTPRAAHAATWLRRHQVHFLNPRRMSGLYAIRPQITDGHVGASFQEIVLVNGDHRRVLGRADDEQVGHFETNAASGAGFSRPDESLDGGHEPAV